MAHLIHLRILLRLEVLFFCFGVCTYLGIFHGVYTYGCDNYLCTLSMVLPLICNTLYTANTDNGYSPLTDGNNVKIVYHSLENVEDTRQAYPLFAALNTKTSYLEY